MRRIFLVLVLALVVSVVVGAGVASATHSKGKGPKKDFANGTGQVETATLDQQIIHVNAQSKAKKKRLGWIVEHTTDGWYRASLQSV